MFALSEESKERIGKIIEVSKIAMHYGYLPLILYLGTIRAPLFQILQFQPYLDPQVLVFYISIPLVERCLSAWPSIS
ncbi:TOM7 family-domain-containing protein [Xylaria arbuscula]|nr:TOM7 family-domain-containing protein [Xylaria arbuscula]